MKSTRLPPAARSLLVIPSGRALLYAGPIYLQARRRFRCRNCAWSCSRCRTACIRHYISGSAEVALRREVSSLNASETPQAAPAPQGMGQRATDINALISEAGKDFADYQRLTAEGKLGEAGRKLDALKGVLDRPKFASEVDSLRERSHVGGQSACDRQDDRLSRLLLSDPHQGAPFIASLAYAMSGHSHYARTALLTATANSTSIRSRSIRLPASPRHPSRHAIHRHPAAGSPPVLVGGRVPAHGALPHLLGPLGNVRCIVLPSRSYQQSRHLVKLREGGGTAVIGGTRSTCRLLSVSHQSIPS